MSYLTRLKASHSKNLQPSELPKLSKGAYGSFDSDHSGRFHKIHSDHDSENSAPKELPKLSKGDADFQKSDTMPTAKTVKSPFGSFDSTDSGHFQKNDDPESLPAALVKAAIRVCDACGDKPEQRERMFADLASYPSNRHAWLTDYLNGEADRLEPPTPEGLGDDRRTCNQCTNFRAWRCLAAWRGQLPATSRQYHPDPSMLRRCEGYQPGADDIDRRHGRDRWPGLTTRTGINDQKAATGLGAPK